MSDQTPNSEKILLCVCVVALIAVAAYGVAHEAESTPQQQPELTLLAMQYGPD